MLVSILPVGVQDIVDEVGSLDVVVVLIAPILQSISTIIRFEYEGIKVYTIIAKSLSSCLLVLASSLLSELEIRINSKSAFIALLAFAKAFAQISIQLLVSILRNNPYVATGRSQVNRIGGVDRRQSKGLREQPK